MAKYLFKRVLHGMISIVIVIAIVMILIYSLMDRNLIFATDTNYTKQNNNSKITYKYQKWEDYGYLDYVTYQDYLNNLVASGDLDEDTKQSVQALGKTAEKDSEEVAEYVEKFRTYYKSLGYKVYRLDAVTMGKKGKIADGGKQVLFACKDIPVSRRVLDYFKHFLSFDSIDYVENMEDADRGISFTFKDPAGGKPAVIGNGTYHKYLFYCDNKFPFVHQNILNLKLGTSYSVNQGIDVWETMTKSQGSYVKSTITYPTGLVEEGAEDLHSATYALNSRESLKSNQDRFTDDYTNVNTVKAGHSKMGYSFILGIFSSLLAYLLGLPLGLSMALKKDKFIDKLLTCYIVFISAVPSVAYIFMVKAIGRKIGLPITFDMEATSKLFYVLPIVSLSLGSIANLMKWIRRYMIDQMNSDYVKFARSGGLSEGEIFSKHILKNAAIPVIHGIPGSILGALTGAIITERVYVVPGAGNMLTEAINKYDNGVIIGVTLFYASLSVISLILGDILMSLVDPRISFSSKDR